MIGIYKITNIQNGKIYVGQSINIIVRWKQHISEASTNRKQTRLYNAMNKYGVEQFKFEVIEECDLTQLDEREKYWIKQYDSYNNGYNSTLGGQGEDSWFYDPTLIQRLWDEGYSTKRIAEIVGCGHTTVNNRLTGYKDYNTHTSHQRGAEQRQKEVVCVNTIYMWSEKQKLYFNCAIPVHQYDLEGNYITSYMSLSAAARAVGHMADGAEVSIKRVLDSKSNQKLAYGFQWSREKVEKMLQVPKRGGKLVQCIETGQIFPSTVDAAKWCGLKSKSNVRECCVGIVKSAGKHPETGLPLHWKYVE